MARSELTVGPWGKGSKHASDLAAMTDGELIERASEWTQHTPFEMELQRRLIEATQAFKVSMDRSSRTIIILTVALVALTVVIAVLTGGIVFNPPA